MKQILILCGIVLIIGGVFFWNKFHLPDSFGTFTNAPRVNWIELTKKPLEFENKWVTIEGVVRKQCSTMGCYFFFESDTASLRVDISEIAMDAPQKNKHHVVVEGQLVPYQDGYQFWASAVKFKQKKE